MAVLTPHFDEYSLHSLDRVGNRMIATPGLVPVCWDRVYRDGPRHISKNMLIGDKVEKKLSKADVRE